MKTKSVSQPQLTPENLRQYQWRALKFVIERPHCALFVDMGLGKTVSTLSAIKHLYHKDKLSGPVLVVAPLRVIYSVWRQEALKWSHTRKLTFSLVHGGARPRMEALSRPAHVYLINPEGIKWLVEYYTRLARGDKEKFAALWPFKMLVVDESTFFKEGSTQRFKALKKVLHLFERRVILTGTPTPNSLLQLWAQMYIVDAGERLGSTFSGFRDRFFEKQDYMGYHYKLREGAQQYMDRMLRSVVLRLQDSDWLELPPLVKDYIRVDLPPRAMELYEKFETEMFLELETAEVEALNAATLTQRCHQLANGAIYALDKESGAKDWHVVHDAKVEALKEYVEELNGERAIIAFTFKHDLARLRAALPDAPVLGPQNVEKLINEWKAGMHQFVLIHPQSGGHGVNDLQVGCRRVLFFSVPWSGEHYAQLIARVGPARRSGEKEPTIVHHIVANKTVDDAIVMALDRKAAGQSELLNALKTYRQEKESEFI
jgi:SNF2 family DNA or RNA helicase